MKNVCVLGDGAWGTAVATLLAHNGHTVKLWCHNPLVADSIAKTGYNQQFLPGIKLDARIQPVVDIAQAVDGARFIFEAVPVSYLRSVLEQARPCVNQQHVWVILSKGIEQQTLMLPSQVLDDVVGYVAKKVIFSGPSFARDLACKDITAVTLAATDQTLVQEVQQLLHNDYFRPYSSTDPVGVQVGGALKNVITLGVGIVEGAGFSDNTKAFLFTRGLQEMERLAQVLGGTPSTLYGLSGVGDLVVTATGKQSRNLLVGQQLGKGEVLETILHNLGGKVPEGINTVQSVHELQQKLGITLPICQGIYEVIFEQLPVKAMLANLMARSLESE